MSEPTANDIRALALDLLASREHSCSELSRKLKAKGFDEDLIQTVISRLRKQNLQSDVRFAQSYVRSRVGRGDGPLKIRSQLRERGIESALAAHTLEEYEPEWQEAAEAAREKRFGQEIPTDYREKARQSRFLERRGFSTEQIRAVFAKLQA